MPGTPTPLLNLTVPSVNGDVGSWGSELNGNLAILDSAVAAAGVNSVSVNTVLAFSPNHKTVYRFTTGASNLTATLPAATLGREMCVLKVDSGAGIVTVLGTIGGFTNYELVNQGQYVTLMGNGSTWDVIGNN